MYKKILFFSTVLAILSLGACKQDKPIETETEAPLAPV